MQVALDGEPFHRYTFEDGTVWTEFHRSGEGYLLRFPELADFEVSADGTEVIAHPAAATDDATVEHLYINQLVPLALSRQGRPAYHASVVTVPGGAVAFLGKTGMGKSTLAASFALNEAAFLTDDALLIEESDGGCLAMPSHASLRLWDDGVEALVDERIAKASAISYSNKARLLAGEALAYSDKPQPLLAAYVLERQNAQDVTIGALTGLDRYMAWLGNSFLLDIEDHGLLAQHFEWTHRISGTVPTFALDYPRDYGILPDVRHAVRQHLLTLGN
jgi:hypothetical protein